ncbi:hypothetical protein HDA40_001840 [Hamadaea flava]|uniref:Uncharacterized protein n=1 Tax=Hamadaea flava TaxID=1742688 RepID=A0ABV8LNN3_9ACTN|nr:hypothetical protein [Hamadaea flava]MCP2323333.1 hypothetical protein [Hamadaea flava]
MRLHDGRRIALKVWEPALVRAITRRPSRHSHHTHAIAQLLTDIPAATSVGDVERHWRYARLALALAPLLVFGVAVLMLRS